MADLTIVDLGQKVKAKYPGQYDDLSDADVGRKVKAKFPGQYDDFKDDTNAAIKAAQAAKFPTKAEGGKPDLPWYAGYFSAPATADRTAAQVAQDQAANVIKGIPQAVTGIPSALKAGSEAVLGLMTGNLKPAADIVKGSVAPILTPVRQGIELARPGTVNAPTPEAPETAQSAQNAGAILGGLTLGAAAEVPQIRAAAGKAVAPVGNAFNAVKAKLAPAFQPTTPGTPEVPIGPADVNKWMNVPAKEVEHGANPGQRLLDEKLLGPDKATTKANVDAALPKAGADMQTALQNATKKGITIDAQTPVYDSAANAVKRIGSPRDSAFQARVDGIIDDIEAKYPNLNKLTPEDAHKLQVELGDSIDWHGEAYNDPINKVMVRIYADLNKALKADVPGIGDLKSRWGDLYSASKNLGKSISRDTVGSGTGAAVPPPTPAVPPGPTPAMLAGQKIMRYAPWAGATTLGLKALKDYFNQTPNP